MIKKMAHFSLKFVLVSSVVRACGGADKVKKPKNI